MVDINRLFDLSGRVAAVTGGASGIGRATAVTLANAGASVVLGDIDEPGMAETARFIEDTGGKAVTLRTNVAKADDVEALVQKAVAEFGRLDIMGNVAGIPHESLVVDTKEEDLDRVLAVNLKGVYFGCQSAMRVMIPQRSGNIINISSGVIDGPGAPMWSVYGIAKAGVAMLTKVLAREAAPHRIRVNALAPGIIITGMTSRHWTDAQQREDEAKKEAFLEGVRGMTPLGVEGKPEDVANAILYLVSDAGQFMTGQILHPNGGTAMPW
ncbi:MAG: SDR family oxidoreductase [Dehalococcoidia bacterium]